MTSEWFRTVGSRLFGDELGEVAAAVVARTRPPRSGRLAGGPGGPAARAPAPPRAERVLTLTVLGCDGSHPAAGGAASGYLVRSWASRTSVWMDAGPGTFANLQRFTDPLRLSAIVLTHEHHDHFSDIEGFITAARWVYGFDRDPIPVYAAPGVLRASEPGRRGDPRLARGGRR